MEGLPKSCVIELKKIKLIFNSLIFNAFNFYFP